MESPGENDVDLHDDEEIVEVIVLSDAEMDPEDLADELEDVDIDNPENAEEERENEGCESIEEMGAEGEQDDSDLTFAQHTGSVFCINLDPLTNGLAVTGGEDDKAYVWRCTSGEVLLECTGHSDSVTCASFSHDSSLVATGDMSGVIKIWKLDSREAICTFEVGDLEWMEWHPHTHVLLAGTDDGTLWMWKIPAGNSKTISSPGCQSTCGKFLPCGKKAVVGYEDGTVRFWDLKRGTVVHILKGQDAHQGALTSLECNQDGCLVLSGAADGSTKIISTHTGKVLGAFSAEENSVKDGECNSVECVGFCSFLPLVAVAYLDGTLAIIDLATKMVRHICKNEAGVVHLVWERSSAMVATGCLDGALRLWDARSGNMVAEYCGHSAEILDFAINREGTMAVTVSGDHKAKVFCLQRPDR